MSDTAPIPPIIVPLTDAPSQSVNVTLGGQDCIINIYTKSINVPIEQDIPTDPPVYENINPVYMDLYSNGTLVQAGVILRNDSLVLMSTAYGFVGDFSIIDTSGNYEDPYGVPARLPPADLMNAGQRALPLSAQGYAPANLAGTIPGLGTRWVLSYWPNLI